MKRTKKSVAAFLLLISSVTVAAQNLSNKGTDFWVGYGHHQFMETGTNTQEMVLYFSADEATTVTVNIWGTAWTKTYNVAAGSVITSDLIPKTAPYDARLITPPCSFVPAGTPCGGEGIFCNKAIHITSTKPVVAYAHIYGSASSGATMLMPVETWGYSYLSVNSEQNYASNCFSWLYVIAKEDNTVIEVTPSVATRGGNPANTPFTVTLNKGCIYQTMAGPENTSAKNQMTGSKIRSIANASGQCFPVAVFSGSSRTANPIACGSGGGDNDNQQLFPSVAWGKRYLTAPLSGSNGASWPMTNSYKVVVKDPATVVRRNGTVLTGLLANSYYFFTSNTADYIEADKPVMIAQFITGGSACAAGSLGDPEMIIISPLEQGINRVGFYRNSKENINLNYLTLIVPTAGLPSLRIDGSNAFDYTYPHTRNNLYTVVVKRWSIGAGQGFQSTATCDSAFTAVTYGLGSVESYGYNAGTLINNLGAQSVLYNQGDPTLADTVQKFTCKGTPLKIKAMVGYKPTNMLWRLSQVANLSPNADVNVANPVLLDSVQVGLAYYYRYELPGTYTFNDTGTFYIPIVNTEQTIESCTHTEEVKIAVVVKPSPYTNLSVSHSGCLLDTAYFASAVNGGNGHTVYKWQWNLGDGKTATAKDTADLYAAPGTYTVTLKVFSREGCVNDTARTITIGNKPVASIVATPPTACPGSPVVFTDTTATATTGTWYWNFGNNSSATLTGNTPQTVTYAAPGTYTVKHLYKSSATCVSDTTTATITVAPKPAKPAVTTPLTYCQNDVASPLTATALAGHTLTWYTVYSPGGGSATAPTPSTATQGATQYYVAQTSPSGCVSDTSIITVNVTPVIANNIISASQTLCSGTAAAALTGTAPTGGGGGYTFQWQQSTDGGATWTAANGTGNAATYSPGVLGSGTTKFRRIVSSGLCSNASNAVDIIVQTNLANYNISASQTICAGSSPALLDGQTPTGGTGAYAYLWESSPDGIAWTPVAGATGEDFQPGVLAVKTYYRRTATGGNCPAISNVVVITVNPLPNGSISPVSGNICQTVSGSVSFTATAGTPPFTVNLLVMPPGGSAASYTVTQTVTSNGPVSIPVVPVNSAGGAYTVVLNSLSDAGNCARSAATAPVTINVTATPALSFSPAAPAVCAGASATLTASGAAAYTWSPATGLSAATGATVTANPPATTTYTVTGTTNNCSGTGTVTVTVNPLPAKPVAATPSITYCQNTATTALSATGLPGHTLTWYNALPLTGGSATAPTPSTATAGTFNYYVTQTNNATGCVSDATTIGVTVTPALAGNTITADQTVCAGTAAAAVTGGAVTGGTGTYVYQWQQSTDGGVTWTNANSGGTAAAYNPGTLLPGTTQFRRVITSGLCTSVSNAVSITVQTSLTNYQVTGTQTLCEGTTPALLDGQTPGGGTGSYTYVWEQSTNGGTTWTPVAGATGEDYQPPALATTTSYRRITSGGLCPATSTPVIVTVNPAPAGTITAPAGICSYQTGEITFTASAGTAPFTVSLKLTSPGGGTSTLNQTVSSNGPVTFTVLPLNSAAGTYTVALAGITDSKGCSKTTGLASVNITVTAKPSVTVTAGAGTICEGTSTTLTASGAAAYTWSPATGLNAATGASVTAAPTVSTAYTVIGATNGCADTVTRTLTVVARPAKPVVASNVDYCLKAASMPLSATAAPGNNVTWSTTYPVTGGTASAPVPPTATAGTVTYYVTQTNSNGCVSDTSVITVTVHPLPLADFGLPAGICMPNGAAQFTNRTTVSDNSTISYAWNFGDGSGTSAAANPSYVYAASGSYAVKLKAVSAFGCADSTTKTLSSFFEKPIALFSVNPAELCQGQNNSFIDNSNPRGSTVTKWWWNFGDGTAPAAVKAPVHRYTRPGTYTVKLVVTTAIGCVSDTFPLSVVVHLQPKIDAGPSFVVPQGTGITFQATANDTTVSLRWSPPTGLSDPTRLRPTLTATQNETYTLTAVGDFNCTATDTLTVRILKPLEIPNAFSPNGDGTNDTWLIPNLADYPGAKVEVFNRWGQQVYLSYGYNKPWDGTYLGKALPLATYYYIITLNNGFKPVAGSVTIIR